MTLIAHGILALDREIKRGIFRKTGLLEDATDRAYDRLEKLRRAEKFLARTNLFNIVTGNKRYLYRDNNPQALAGAIVGDAGVVVAAVGITAIALGTSPIWGPVLYKVKKNERLRKEAEAAEAAAEEAAFRKAEAERIEKENEARILREKQERIENERAAEAEKTEIDFALTLIDEASALLYREPDERKDLNAMVAGLVGRDWRSHVAEIYGNNDGDDHILFLYGDNANGGISIFFHNPETGNFEQVAQVNSSIGIYKIVNELIQRNGGQRHSREFMNEQLFEARRIRDSMSRK